MKITRIGHISVNVDGREEEVQAFYNGLLGLRLINDQRPQAFKDAIPGDWFELGDERLHVFNYPVGSRFRTPGSVQPGGPHFAIYVEDLDGAVAELEAAKLPFASSREGVDRQVWILDPGGNTIELNQDPATFKA